MSMDGGYLLDSTLWSVYGLLAGYIVGRIQCHLRHQDHTPKGRR